MKKGILIVFLLLSMTWAHASGFKGVTYEFSGGRFGDNLLTYLHAKWIAYEYGIPLMYKPFKYSDQLVLDDREKKFDTFRKNVHLEVLLGRSFSVQHALPFTVRYVCPYFPEDVYEREHFFDYKGEKFPFFEVNWKDPDFRKIVREMIAPKNPIPTIQPTHDRINIAIHVREGGGYDPTSFALVQPLKMPPMSFYKNGLMEMIRALPGKPLYFYIFTDALHPEKIAADFQSYLEQKGIEIGDQIVFDYRKADNSHTSNVVEDFFSLLNFDVLIRAQSNFSIVASLINDYAVVYSPINYVINSNEVEITEVEVAINPESYKKLLAK